jgi:ABC-type multidrug transport system ATPase subunit
MHELVIDDIGKRYGRAEWALRGLSVRLSGGILGLVGPNGAGKTTLLRILATVLRPTSGVVTWNGRDIVADRQALRRTLGYLPQDFGIYPQLSARDFLSYIGELKGLTGPLLRRRVEAALEAVRLHGEADRRLRTFSRGMVQRVGIAQTLLNEPRLLVLDEPTAGLDPAERTHLRRTLATLGHERVVVLSTHIMSDVETVATDLVLLQQGRLVWSGTPGGLLADAEGQVWSVTVPEAASAHLRARHVVVHAVPRDGGSQLRLLASASPHPLAAPVPPTLEDAYLLFAGTAPAAPAAVP